MSDKATTVRTLTSYQIDQLKGLFILSTIHHIGRIDETEELIVEYTPTFAHEQGMQVRRISMQPDAITNQNTNNG